MVKLCLQRARWKSIQFAIETKDVSGQPPVSLQQRQGHIGSGSVTVFTSSTVQQLGRRMTEEAVNEDTASTYSSGVQGTKVLATQVGGHRYGKNGNKTGMLDRGNGLVLKALQAPPRGTRELALYQTTFALACQDKDLLELRHFLPLYFGTEVIDDVTFLVMNNIVHNFAEPNVLDLKMGLVTYDPEASAEKREHEEKKYPSLKQLGFQLTGMMVHDRSTGCAKHFAKDYCRSVTAETMLTEGLGKFFGLQDGHLRKDVLVALLGKLRRIEQWFLVQHTFAFYASSLLIVYSSLNRGAAPDITVANSSQDKDPTSSVPITGFSPGANLRAGTPGGSSGTRTVNGTVCGDKADPATNSIQTKRSEFSRSASTSNKLCAGQKRGRKEQKEEDQSLTQSDPFYKLPRTHPEEGSISEKIGKAGPSESKQSQNSPSESKRGHKSSSESKGQTGLPEFREETHISDNEGGSRISEISGERESFQTKETESREVARTCKSDPPLVEVRMIDFAHVFPASGKDSNYLFGLQKLISLLEQLLKM